jgi:membrane-anchored protein YejM (alkaline phosphatase superfamily)
VTRFDCRQLLWFVVLIFAFVVSPQDALVEEIDEEVGTLLSTLGDDAVNTLVIFTSDHGEMLGAHGKREKNNFHEGMLRS